jgi:soluble lytic murein transglycosylase-like protein
MRTQISYLIVSALMAFPSGGCREPEAHAERHHRVIHEISLEEKIARDRAQREREQREQDTLRRARWAEEERAAQLEAKRIHDGIEALAASMYRFGLKRLPAIQANARKQDVYRRHLHGYARILFLASESHEPKLISREDDPYLLAAISQHESSWAQRVIDGRQRGSRLEIGAFQLVPDGVCSRSIRGENRSRLDLVDPTNNARLAAACLSKLHERYQDPDIWHTLARYASGKSWPIGRQEAGEFRAIYEELRGL